MMWVCRLEHLVLKNAMRATSVRIELLMRVIDEACKRRVTGRCYH